MHAITDSDDLAPMDRVYLNFALGKAAEDQNDFESAFRYYASGNELKQAQSRYHADDTTEEFAAQKQACTKSLFFVS